MDCDWQAAVFAANKEAGIRQVGYVPDAGHAVLIQEMQAFDERAAALLGVTASSSNVRPMRRIAGSKAKRFDARLTDRFANLAALASTSPAATEPMRGNSGTSGIPGRTGEAAGARVTRESVGDMT